MDLASHQLRSSDAIWVSVREREPPPLLIYATAVIPDSTPGPYPGPGTSKWDTWAWSSQMRVNAVAFFLFWLKHDSAANELDSRPIGATLGCTIFYFGSNAILSRMSSVAVPLVRPWAAPFFYFGSNATLREILNNIVLFYFLFIYRYICINM